MGPFPLHQQSLIANGNVRPFRFLHGVAGTEYVAVEAADSTKPCLGVSRGTHRYPVGSPSDDGFVAVTGEELSYIGWGRQGEVLLGTAVTDLTVPLVAYTDGTFGAGSAKPIVYTGTTPVWVAALPEQLGAIGEVIRITVLFPFRTHPALV